MTAGLLEAVDGLLDSKTGASFDVALYWSSF